MSQIVKLLEVRRGGVVILTAILLWSRRVTRPYASAGLDAIGEAIIGFSAARQSVGHFQVVAGGTEGAELELEGEPAVLLTGLSDILKMH